MSNNPESANLSSVVDRLIPGDTDWPSASQNGVLDYLDHQLRGDLARFEQWLLVGLKSLNDESVHRTGKVFEALATEDQDQILTDIEAGEIQTPWPISSQEFFSRLNEWTAEGYYSDPEHNHGNPGKLSWKMIGFDERK